MAIGKIANRRWEGSGDTKRQIVHIILLPTFPADKYNELQPQQHKTALGAGAGLWAESGQQLEVIDTGKAPSGTGFESIKTQYPYLVAKSLDDGNVYGKITNNDKEALEWIKKVATDLFPSKLRMFLPGGASATAEYYSKWKPLKERLDSSQHASDAARVLREIREQKKLPGIEEESKNTTLSEGTKITAQAAKNEGAQALKEASAQIKTEVKDWWEDISPLWKTGLIGGGVILAAVVISEKVK